MEDRLAVHILTDLRELIVDHEDEYPAGATEALELALAWTPSEAIIRFNRVESH